MNSETKRLLRSYCAGVRYPESHGLELDHLLFVRDGLHEAFEQLATQERAEVEAADRILLENAAMVAKSLAETVDIRARREELAPGSSRWWWYLDVIANLPRSEAPTTGEVGHVSTSR